MYTPALAAGLRKDGGTPRDKREREPDDSLEYAQGDSLRFLPKRCVSTKGVDTRLKPEGSPKRDEQIDARGGDASTRGGGDGRIARRRSEGAAEASARDP